LSFGGCFADSAFGITPYVFELADLERGYNGTGGEIFIPLIPFLVYAIKDSVKEMKGEYQMTVKDLIEILKGFDESCELFVLPSEASLEQGTTIITDSFEVKGSKIRQNGVYLIIN